MNKYFSNIGKNLALNILESLHSSVNKDPNHLSKQLISKPVNSFVILPTDETEVSNIIKSLKTSSSTGHDGISSSFLKQACQVLAGPIAFLCNNCFSCGVFPNSLKKATIIPLHKNGDSDDVSNYRPISLLPNISKIIEKLINIRLKNYLEHHNLLSANQYGFRSKKSTVDAVRHLYTHIISNLDSSNKCLGIFLDLKKAFDTVSIPLLISKMENKGIRGIPLQLLRNYLSDRKQVVKIENFVSNEETIDFGVPQGSVLGPTLFLIYIDDLCRLTLPGTEIISFADDTVVLCTGNEWKKLGEQADINFKLITNWLDNNLLTLNEDKTKYMTFSMRSNTQPNNGLIELKHHKCKNIQNCDCYCLSNTSSIRYLGVIINSQLTWKEHILSVTNRVRKLFYVFKNIRHICDRKLLNIIYTSLCQSILLYCILIWGGCVKTHLLKLERAQRAILKIMTFKPIKYSTQKLYEETKILTVRQLYLQTLITYQHKQPKPLDLNKRRKDKVFHLPKLRTKLARNQFSFLGPLIYNKISKSINLRELTLYSCKKAINNYLLSQNYNSTEDLLS